ncbi:cystin-1-like [Dromaius novaehollandiae]|uniref:cystin-1-like n=1 Tax=Dromaius novaehollandiae TaxID=8790 RepID=UPI00311D81FF
MGSGSSRRRGRGAGAAGGAAAGRGGGAPRGPGAAAAAAERELLETVLAECEEAAALPPPGAAGRCAAAAGGGAGPPPDPAALSTRSLRDTENNNVDNECSQGNNKKPEGQSTISYDYSEEELMMKHKTHQMKSSHILHKCKRKQQDTS